MALAALATVVVIAGGHAGVYAGRLPPTMSQAPADACAAMIVNKIFRSQFPAFLHLLKLY